MIAIFSNWSKPQESNQHAGYANLEDFKIGISTAIQCAARFYECHFVGDAFSVEVVKELQLPLKSIQVVNFEEKAPNGLWNYSKLKACSLFEAPFIHIDNDVFLLKKLPEFKEYLFQNLEDFNTHPWYDQPINNMKALNVDESIFNPTVREAYNCGIIGIGDNELIKEWINPVLELIESCDFKEFIKSKPCFYEIVIEQFTATCSAQNFSRDVKFLLRNSHIQEDAKKNGYIHMISKSKRNASKMQKIRNFYLRNFKHANN